MCLLQFSGSACSCVWSNATLTCLCGWSMQCLCNGNGCVQAGFCFAVRSVYLRDSQDCARCVLGFARLLFTMLVNQPPTCNAGFLQGNPAQALVEIRDLILFSCPGLRLSRFQTRDLVTNRRPGSPRRFNGADVVPDRPLGPDSALQGPLFAPAGAESDKQRIGSGGRGPGA